MTSRRDTIDWERPDIRRRLGKEPDRVLADELGVTRERVRQIRKVNRIPDFMSTYRKARALERTADLDDIFARLGHLLGTAKDAAVAREHGVDARLVRAARIRAEIQEYTTPCGSSSKYSHGCRCDLCRAAHAARIADWNARNPEKFAKIRATALAKALASAPHRGKMATVSKYVLGCRCDGCVRRMRKYSREYNRRRKVESAAVAS